jgi:predicted Zn-dependent protease
MPKPASTRTLLLLALALLLSPPALRAQDEEPAEGGKPELSPLVKRLLDDALTTDEQRRAMLIFHGQWDQVKDPTPAEQARIALGRFDLTNKALADDAAPPLVRAEAALWRGEPEKTLAALAETESAQADLLRARALEDLGRTAQAIAVLNPWREKLQKDQVTTAPELVAAAQGLADLAMLEGRPAQDYHLVMQLLGKARTEMDRLYWPANVAEAELLIDKDGRPDAAKALADALPLNPNAGRTLYLLGLMAAEGFDFQRAALITKALRDINPEHLLADLLEARSYLSQRDPDSARKVIEPALARYPKHRELLALLAATEAVSYRFDAAERVLAHLDELSPGSAVGPFTVGDYLSSVRQYDASEAMLRRAIKRQPNWPAPRVELGLMLMQAGKEEEARVELAAAARLDPFDMRANNQLQLVEQLLGYKRIETERFIIKYKDGIDAALANDMAVELDGISHDVCEAFSHVPPRKTSIEIMPDEKWFGVRITGMPEIWTIAACTGDVIAMTPPREGPHQRGPYDWEKVLRHEYTHTVTLDQTSFRVPHWFTEAAAVSQEPGGRDYNTCQLLASALHANKLFDLDQINWGFVRPRTPQDRPLAYAQAHWMFEYITVKFGHQAIIDLLALQKTGVGDKKSIEQVTGQTADQFMSNFRAWGQQQVKAWGLAAPPKDAQLIRVLEASGPPDDKTLDALLANYPGQPDVLKLAAERALKQSDPVTARQTVLRYAAARPVDPWPHQALVKLALETGRDDEAIASLEELDRRASNTGAWAEQLAKIYRSRKDFTAAARAANRALHREPYNATYRELAAAIDLQRGDMTGALRHVTALTAIEPDRAIHWVRLAALCYRMDKKDDAKAAAAQALKIDPKAPVQAYMN